MYPQSAEKSSFYKTESRSADFKETPTMSLQKSHHIQEVCSAVVLLPAPRLITASFKIKRPCDRYSDYS